MEEQKPSFSDSRIPRSSEDINFDGLLLKVFPSVFYPRQETLFWVKKATNFWLKKKGLSGTPQGLDIFCGTGVLGIYFLSQHPSLQMTFSDLSVIALYNTLYNLKRNSLLERAKVIYSDLFSSFSSERFDLVLANPPYVAQERRDEVAEEVLASDPLRSFWGGKEGMEVIERFLDELPYFVAEKGIGFIEVDPWQIPIVERRLSSFFKTGILKDQFGKPRVVWFHRS